MGDDLMIGFGMGMEIIALIIFVFVIGVIVGAF